MRTRLSVRTRTTLGVVVISGVIFTGCSAPTAPAPDPAPQTTVSPQAAAEGLEALLVEQGLDGLDGRELITHLDQLPVAERPTDVFASIRADHVLISDMAGEDEQQVAIPDDEFYVSLAPFINQTHDCFFHSLTTCKGELSNAELKVMITNDADGTVLVDEVTRTFDNGFVGYWLPRGVDATVTIEHDGRSVTAAIATGPDDATCVTTLQLV